MSSNSSRRMRVTCVLAMGGLLIAALRAVPPATAADNAVPQQGRAAELISLGLKFGGAQSCATADCHGGSAPKASGPLQNELTTWNDSDSHAKAFSVLDKVPKALAKKHPELKEIGTGLGIDNVATSARCLSCHALPAQANLQGDKFDANEGVTCGSCHGPSEKWLADHKQKDWTNKQREARAATAGDVDWKGQAAHARLLKDLGLYDTKPLMARAEICVACHLAIDPELVEKGHPQPFFELNHFQEIQPKHWRELPADAGIGHVRVWTVGQLVCMREAMNQLAARADNAKTSADSLKESLTQALAHGAMVKQLLDAKGIDAPADGLADLAKLKAALADPAAKRAEISVAAKVLARQLKTLANPALAMQPSKDLAMKLAKSIAADADLAKDLGRHGAQQQALAIWSLLTATGAAESDELKALAEFKSAYLSDKFDADAYAAALKAAAPK